MCTGHSFSGVVTTIFDCTVSFWALCASGNTTFINNSFCQNLALFFFSSLFSLNEPHFPFQFLRLLSGLSFALPFQLPRYFTVFFFSFLTPSTELPHAVPCGEQKGSENPSSVVSKGAGELLCIAKEMLMNLSYHIHLMIDVSIEVCTIWIYNSKRCFD